LNLPLAGRSKVDERSEESFGRGYGAACAMRSLWRRKCREASRAEPPAPTAYPLPKTLRVFDLPARGRFRAECGAA
jgi:hypothetical protein